MQYELCKELHRPKRMKAAAVWASLSEKYKGKQKPDFKVNKDRTRLCPGMVEMAISETITQLGYCLCLEWQAYLPIHLQC